MITKLRTFAEACAHPSAKRTTVHGCTGPVNAVEVDGTLFIQNDEAEAKAKALLSEAMEPAFEVAVASEAAATTSAASEAAAQAPVPELAVATGIKGVSVHAQKIKIALSIYHSILAQAALCTRPVSAHTASHPNPTLPVLRGTISPSAQPHCLGTTLGSTCTLCTHSRHGPGPPHYDVTTLDDDV